jgi:hypothetical protein
LLLTSSVDFNKSLSACRVFQWKTLGADELSHPHHPEPQSHPRWGKRQIDGKVIDKLKHHAKESSVLDC